MEEGVSALPVAISARASTSCNVFMKIEVFIINRPPDSQLLIGLRCKASPHALWYVLRHYSSLSTWLQAELSWPRSPPPTREHDWLSSELHLLVKSYNSLVGFHAPHEALPFDDKAPNDDKDKELLEEDLPAFLLGTYSEALAAGFSVTIQQLIIIWAQHL